MTIRIGLALALPAALAAQEAKVALKDAPPAVIRNVTARFPNATVSGVAKEREEGQDVYEVTLAMKGRNIDVTTTPAGALTLIEKEIAGTELPAAVSALLRDKFPAAAWKVVEEVTRVAGTTETLAFYEILLVDAKKRRLEVQIDPDGSRVLAIEEKKPGESD